MGYLKNLEPYQENEDYHEHLIIKKHHNDHQDDACHLCLSSFSSSTFIKKKFIYDHLRQQQSSSRTITKTSDFMNITILVNIFYMELFKY